MVLSLKRYLPRGLFGRTLLILIIPVLILQGLVSFLYVERHYDRVSRQLSRAAAKDLSYVVTRLEQEPVQIETLDMLAESFHMRLRLQPGERLKQDGISRSIFDLTGHAVAETLHEEIDRALVVDLDNYAKRIDIYIQTDVGVLHAIVPRRYMIAERPHLLLVWTGAVSLVLVVIAILFLRNQIRPIRQLAQAAEAFGRGQTPTKFQPSGALEVRQASRAFLKMRARIERMVEQRTQMLLGISHDLRTPLTRMKLTLALQDDALEGVKDLRRDVNQMENMIAAFLDFGQKSEEATQAVALKAFIETLVYDTQRAHPVCKIQCVYLSDVQENTAIQLKPKAFERCLQNLLENACRFGNTVRISVRLLPKRVEFFIEDNGQGIPEAQREDAFRSFNRLDAARNQDTGGSVGLGLTIARDIVHNHGGSIDLKVSKNLKGLEVFISIPK